MDWVDKELWLAAATGACTGVGVMIPMALEQSALWSGLLIFPAFIGAIVGILVGLVAVGGGRYALWTNRLYPAGSHRSWRHRFAACTAGAVTLVVGGVFCWAVIASEDLLQSNAGFPPWLVAIAAVSYTFAFLLAPAREVRQHQG